jgi:hypothetical protein
MQQSIAWLPDCSALMAQVIIAFICTAFKEEVPRSKKED